MLSKSHNDQKSKSINLSNSNIANQKVSISNIQNANNPNFNSLLVQDQPAKKTYVQSQIQEPEQFQLSPQIRNKLQSCIEAQSQEFSQSSIGKNNKQSQLKIIKQEPFSPIKRLRSHRLNHQDSMRMS